MKYHIMYTLEHGYSLEARNIAHAATQARQDLLAMGEPTARLVSIFVDGYAPDEVPKAVEVEIDLSPSAA